MPKKMPQFAGAIVVLGSPNDDQGNLSSIAIERCDHAVHEFNRHANWCVIPTGGFGTHFNVTATPHYVYAKRYLIAQGIPKHAIIGAVESTNTIEDAGLTRPVVDRYAIQTLLIVSSDFHLDRARILFEREFPAHNLQFTASQTCLPPDELAARWNHERRAIARLQPT